MDRLLVATAVGLMLVSVVSVARGEDHTPPGTAAQRALEYFAPAARIPAAELFRERRSPAPSAAMRRDILASLPTSGAVTPGRQAQDKLDALAPVLEYSDRHHAPRYRMELRVFMAHQAFAGLYARTVVILSSEVLDLLSADELRAIVAHELGHDYFWDDYEQARKTGDSRRVQELELRCDGLAALTLTALHLPTRALSDAVAKMTRYNQERGATETAGRYVTLGQRMAFIRDFLRLRAATDAPKAPAVP